MKLRFELWLFAFYAAVFLVISYPLVTRFSTSIYGLSDEYVLKAAGVAYSGPVRNADAYARLWSFWWHKHASEFGGTDQFSPLLGVSGTNLTDKFLDLPILETVGKALTDLTNEVFSYNFLMLLSFPLAGLAMYFLARHLTGNRWAAALAGFIYSFAPLHQRYAFEWLGMSQWHWLPLYILALLKLDETKKIKWGLAAGLAFTVLLVENYYFGYFAIFFTLAFVIFRLIQTAALEHRFYFNWRMLRSYLAALGSTALLTLPITLTFVREFSRRATGLEGEISGFVRDEWYRFALSARPWHYVFPDVLHPVFGKLTERVYGWLAERPPYFITQPFYPAEHSLFLGWAALILAAVAIGWWLLRRPGNEVAPASNTSGSARQRVGLFFFLGLVMAIFSAPPYATISLHKIYFPSYPLYQLFPMFRSYARFGVLVLLCVAVLAAFGFQLILAKLKAPRLKWVLVTLTFGVVFFEFLNFPPVHNVGVGSTLPVYEWLGQQPGEFGVLVYPQDLSNYDLLAQRTYRQRFLNPKGLVSAEVRVVVENLNTPEAAARLREWGVRYIVLRQVMTMGLEGRYRLVATYEHPKVFLFEVPDL